MFDQIIDTINTLVGVGSLVVSVLAYRQTKNRKGKHRK